MLSPDSEELRRSEAGESPEIADEMGLVEIAAIQGHIRPREPLPVSDPPQGLLEARIRQNSLGVSPTSSVNRRMNVLGLRPTCRITSPTVGACGPAWNSPSANATAGCGARGWDGLRQQRLFEDVEHGRRRLRFEQPLVQGIGPTPPERLQGDVGIVQLAGGQVQEREGPARLETHAHRQGLAAGLDHEVSEWAPKTEGPGESSRRSMTSPMVPVGSTRSLTRTEASHR